MKILKIFLIAVTFIDLHSCQSATNMSRFNGRKGLYDKLFGNNGYDKSLKPPDTTAVSILFDLITVLSLAEKDQIISLQVFTKQEWEDRRLKWSPLEFGNITDLYVASDKIWVPDTEITSTADTDGFIKSDSYCQASLSSDGTVSFIKVLNQMKSRCKMNVEKFPFDQQSCKISLTSASYSIDDLYYEKLDSSLLTFTENQIWSLKSFNYTVINISYTGYESLYSEIIVTIVLQRKPLYIIINLMLPALFLSMVTLIAFFIPNAQSIPISMSILLSYSVLTLKVSESLPMQSESVPKLALYFIICMAYSISGMAWFACTNKMKENKMIPSPILYFSVYVLALFLNGPKAAKERIAIIRKFKTVEDSSQIQKSSAEKESLLLNSLSTLNRFVFFCFLFFVFIFNLIFFVVYPQLN